MSKLDLQHMSKFDIWVVLIGEIPFSYVRHSLVVIIMHSLARIGLLGAMAGNLAVDRRYACIVEYSTGWGEMR